MEPMYYIGLDVHKRKISYCVKDSSGRDTSDRAETGGLSYCSGSRANAFPGGGPGNLHSCLG